MMNNLEHALDVYKDIKSGGDVTKDFGELYFVIQILAEEYLKEIAQEETRALVKKK
jgi:hypothetical protein